MKAFHHSFSIRFLSGRIFCLLLTFLLLSGQGAWAQESDIEARTAQWNSYGIPPGQFVRQVDQKQGWSLWHPTTWKNISKQENDGAFHLIAGESEANLLVITESIPDGYGVANYTSAVLQQFRNQRVNLDQLLTRRIWFGGVEGREIILEMEADNGTTVRQTIWLAAVGPRAYGFFFGAKPENYETFEPYFKRVMMTARLHAAGHWNEEFEKLRTRFVREKNDDDGSEIEAAQLAENMRTAKLPVPVLWPRLISLAGRSPDAAMEMLTDGDAQVRAAAIAALGEVASKNSDARLTDVLLWALDDKEAYCSAVAAKSVAALVARADQKNAILSALKNRLDKLAENPASLVNQGLAFDQETAYAFTEDLLSSGSAKLRAVGLQLIIVRRFDGLKISLDKLFQPADREYLSLLGEMARTHPQQFATGNILPFLKNETEAAAARVLGETASADVVPALEKRLKEIDVRFEKSVPPPPPPKRSSGRSATVTPPRGTVTSVSTLFKGLEVSGLIEARREISDAVEKIKLRDRWAKAKDATERETLLKTARDGVIGEWAEMHLAGESPDSTSSGKTPVVDAARFSYVPTTGANLFPQHTSLYLMAPNFEQTLMRLNSSLTGVQMNTVRDQMTFALMLNIFRTQLAGFIDAEAAGNLSNATGIDFKSPVSVAEWNSGSREKAIWHSALLMRVTDQERFERTLSNYQHRLGNFGAFATTGSVLTRFAGTMPAVVPLVMASAFSEEKESARPSSQKLSRLGRHTVIYRHERLGNLPVTVIERMTNSVIGLIVREQMHIVYFGSTALIAPSRQALLDLLQQAAAQPSIEQNEAFAQSLGEAGELVYFSNLEKLYRSSVGRASAAEDFLFEAVAGVLGNEYGALKLTSGRLESVSHLNLKNNEWFKSLRPFKPQDLAAPRDLLPASTVLYAGSVVEPMKLLTMLKTLESLPDSDKEEKSAEEKQRDKEFNDELEQKIFPHLHGEMAFAILNLAAALKSDFNQWPAWAFAFRLKSSAPGALHRNAKLFKSAAYSLEAKVFNSPAATSQALGASIHFTVTDHYLILADSLETLRMLEAKEKFAATRDYTRSLESVPENLALFTTFSPDAALAEARRLSAKDENTQRILSIVSAMTHAFHSQRAYISVDPQSLSKNQQVAFEGNLSVSFDREGRYAVSRVGPRNGEFDVANALITPKGLNILQPTRLESVRLRVTAKQPDIIQRVRDDIAAFAWQKAATTGDENALVYLTSARRIPDKLTVRLPVTLSEMQPFLRATPRINSDAAEVIELAKKIAGKDRDGRRVARKLGAWTHTNLKWKKVESTTLGTLASREADCLEHSELYAALARSLGLPARVVSGAAFSGGAFGAHAWVEIWLGRWVEIDPTWGLMDYVDATHLRFGSDGFVDYAMLNQIDLEVLEARAAIADFQRDPVRLVREFSSGAQRQVPADEKKNSTESETEESDRYIDPTRPLAFDLALTAQHVFGADALAKFNDKQRNAVVAAFERSTSSVINAWLFDWEQNITILSSEIKGHRAEMLTVIGNGLLRLHLAARDGAWFIAEIENVDEATSMLGDALRGAIHPTADRTKIQNLSYSQHELALKKVNELIKVEGESPSLLMLKASIFQVRELDEELSAGESEKKSEAKDKSPRESEKLWREMVSRWPDYAPAWYALGTNLEAENSLEPLQRYAKLMPLDPRPWATLGSAYTGLKRHAEAEQALREAAARDQKNYLRYISLAGFLTDQAAIEKARQVLLEALKIHSSADEVFAALGEEVTLFDEDDKVIPERCQSLEQLLSSLPKEVSASREALQLLSRSQRWQENYDAAIKSLQRAAPLGLETYEHTEMAVLHRLAKRYAQSLAAANQALKLDVNYAAAHYERACSLTQLKRYREAIAALKKSIELNDAYQQMLNVDDLQPLTKMAEFKALLPKPESEPKDEKSGETTSPQKPEKL